MDMSLSKLWEMVKDREMGCAAVCGVTKVGHNWTTEQSKAYLAKMILNYDSETLAFTVSSTLFSSVAHIAVKYALFNLSY